VEPQGISAPAMLALGQEPGTHLHHPTRPGGSLVLADAARVVTKHLSFEFLSTEPYQTTRSPARPVWGIDSSTVVFCADEFRYQEGVAPGSGEAHPGPSCDPGNGGVSGDSQPSQLIARPQLGNDKDQRLPANRRQGGAVAPHAYLPCSWVLTVGSGLGGVPRTAARRSSTKRSARG
jgi:hypothetical protein